VRELNARSINKINNLRGASNHEVAVEHARRTQTVSVPQRAGPARPLGIGQRMAIHALRLRPPSQAVIQACPACFG